MRTLQIRLGAFELEPLKNDRPIQDLGDLALAPRLADFFMPRPVLSIVESPNAAISITPDRYAPTTYSTLT